MKIKINRDVLQHLLNQGLQCSKIADKLGYSQPTIRRVCRELGLDVELKENGKISQRIHNRQVRWLHGKRSRL